MGFSEFIILILIYSGLMIYFLLPFSNQDQLNDYKGQVAFTVIFKKKLVEMINHKKAVFALLLVGSTLIIIPTGFESAASHYNAHSGYSPVSNNLKTLFSLVGLVIYTVALLLVLGYTRTLKIMKSATWCKKIHATIRK